MKMQSASILVRVLSQIRHNGYIKLFILLKGNAYRILYCCIDFVQSEGIRFNVAPNPPSIILAAAHDEKATRPKGENVASTRADINVIEEGGGGGPNKRNMMIFSCSRPHTSSVIDATFPPSTVCLHAVYTCMHASHACMHA